MKYPQHLLKLIEALKKLPGVGNKSAERFAFQLIEWKPHELQEFGNIVSGVAVKLRHCTSCGCLAGEEPCGFCDERRLAHGSLCVIASPRDAFAIEETKEFQGTYHVLGGLLSPMEGRGPDSIDLNKLRDRVMAGGIREVVIALDSTIEGDATALYVKRELEALPLKISRLAFGLPMGSSLDYVDGGTLARAFLGRAAF